MASKEEDASDGSGCTTRLLYLYDQLFSFSENPEKELVEVHVINKYAVFMGYLSMAVRGLAFLVVTWTTVILLGGFVSVLGKKDVWCLTMITLSQSVGVFDVFMKEKLTSKWHAYRGLYIASAAIDPKTVLYGLEKSLGSQSQQRKRRYACLAVAAMVVVLMFRILLTVVTLSVQAVLFAGVLLLTVLYLLGLHIATAISLWRLVQHDFDSKTEDVGGNLKPALYVLYSLALIQGVVFCYKIMFSRREKYIVEQVSVKWKDDKAAAPAVREYLRETRAGCEKDPSFAKQRNLATYAVDLIESSSSPDSYLSGIQILDVLLRYSDDQHRVLIRHLIGWGSSGRLLRKLLGTIGTPGSLDDETRKRATSIVKHLADAKEICLEQFPGGIRRISSMLDDDDADTSRVQDGLRIIGDLADGDEDNRRVISSTHGLLSRLVALLGGAEGLHSDHGAMWEGVACIIARLVTDQGETGVKVRREVSTSKTSISRMESVLKCVECRPWDRIKANDILVHLSLSAAGTSAEENFATSYMGRKEEILVGILAYSFFPRDGEGNDDSVDGRTREDRVFAYEKLKELSLESKNSAMIILRAKDDVLSNLISMLVDDDGNNSTDRASAAEILNNLCSHYTKDDECFDILKRALTNNVMPKVLEEVFGWSTREEIQEITGANGILFSGAAGTDLEKGSQDNASRNSVVSPEAGIEAHNASKDNAMNSSLAPSHELEENGKQDENYHILKEALLSLCTSVCEKMANVDEDLARRLDEMVASICLCSGKPICTFTTLVKETQEVLDKEKEARHRAEIQRTIEACAKSEEFQDMLKNIGNPRPPFQLYPSSPKVITIRTT